MLTQYRQAIKLIENKNKQDVAVFPNFFNGMPYKHMADSLEEFIQSTLNRMKLPHLHNGKPISEDFFKHVTCQALQLAEEANCDIDIHLYIGGGVVRSLLGYAYKYLYQRSMTQRLGPDAHYQDSLDLIEQMPQNSEEEERLKSQLKLRNIIKSSEFHLKSAKRHKNTLLAPFVLGVGSDLNLYYEIISKNDAPLTQTQIFAENKIQQALVEYINALENSAKLHDDHNTIKHSLLPVADVKEYHAQMERTLAQGAKYPF